MAQSNDITGMEPHVLMASLSYLGILVLIPLFAGASKNAFVKFHAKQGLVILVIEILAIIAANWVSSLGGFVFVLMLIASLAGLFRCLHGEKWVIPGVGALAELFNL